MKIEVLEYLESLSEKYNINFNTVLHYLNENIFTVEDKLIEKTKKN